MPEAGKKTLELKNIEFVVLAENSLFLVICFSIKKNKPMKHGAVDYTGLIALMK